MRKLLALLFLITCFSAFAQDSLTAVNTGGAMVKIEWNWTSNGSGDAAGVTTDLVPGLLYSITTTPDATDVPTDNYDVVVKNQFVNTSGSDVVLSTDRANSLALNRDQTNTELVELWPQLLTTQGKLRIEISNAGSAKEGRVTIIVFKTLAITTTGGGLNGLPLGGASAQLLQYFSNGQAKWITASGDLSVADGGAFTIANGAVTAAKTSITGTPTGSKFLRDDWTWQSTAGGTITGPGSSTNNAVVLWNGTGGTTIKDSTMTYSGTALTVPADILITGGNGLAQQSGTWEWYKSTGVAAGDLRYRFVYDTDTEGGSYTGSNLYLVAYNNTGDGSQRNMMFLDRNPANPVIIYQPLKLSDGTNTLFEVTDAGTTGNVNITGALTIGTALTDANVSDTITVGPSGSVNDSALSANVAHVNAVETIASNWVNTANPWADNEVADAQTISGGTINNSPIGNTTKAAGGFTTLTSTGNGTFGDASTDTHTFTGIAGFYGNTPDSDWAAGFARSIRIYKGTAYDYTASTTDVLITNSADNSRFIVGQDLTNYLTTTWVYNATAGSASSRIQNNANQTLFIGKDSSSPISFPGTTDHDGNANFDAGVTIGDAVTDTLHINPSSITLEGDAADANELTLTTAALGADYTQTFQAKTGTVALTSDISGGTLYSNSTRVGNLGGGEDDLMTYTVSAGQLAANNSRLEVYGTFDVDTGGANTLKFYWNGVAVYNSGSVTPSNANIDMHATIIRTGATSQNIIIRLITSSTTHTERVVQTTGTATLSGTVVLKWTGQDAGSTDDDIAQTWGAVEYKAAA